MLRFSVQKRCTNSYIFSNVQFNSLVSRRNIFVVSSERRNRAARRSKQAEEKREKLNEFISAESERNAREQEAEYQRKLKELRLLTNSVSRIIRKKEQKKKDKERLQSIPMPSEVLKESDKVYQALEGPSQNDKALPASNSNEITARPREFNPSKHSLVVPAVSIPESISERLGLSVRYLVSKTDQNWQMVLQQLEEGGGFKDIPPRDVKKLIYEIPRKYIPQIIPSLEMLLDEVGLRKSSRIVNVFIEGLSSGSTVSDERLKQIEDYCEYLRQTNEGGKLSRQTYELMIQAYGKNNNLDKINVCLAEMKENKIESSPTTFTRILATCVYKANDHKQAVEIFDSMKFLSQKTKPSTKAYQDIIVSYINNDNVEKALDLYQEMLSEKVPVNQRIMVALARGCTSRPSLKFKAWDFIFEIYNNDWEPTLNTYEYILYLSAKDGDIALSRALYSRLNESNSVTSRALSFLLLAYSKSSLKSDRAIDPPTITFHEKGRIFRRNILSDTRITPTRTLPKNSLPLLPVLDLTSKEEVMAESSALWAHTLMFNPDFINVDSTNTYLNIAAEMGKLSDFIDRFDASTYLDRAGLPIKTRMIIEEPEEPIKQDTEISIENLEKPNNNSSLVQEKFDETSLTKSPLLKDLTNSSDNRTIKVARTSLTYVIALKAASKFKNYKFAQRIWSERGDYRKTSSFKSLPRKVKDDLDFEFASAMVLCLTRMKLLDDAVAILLSTEYQFRWTWKELNELYRASVEVGNDTICKTIRGIAKRAQINYEGKIRRKDYKRYVMERGY